MDEKTLQKIQQQLNNDFVVFHLSERMLENHEFNATIPIRKFLEFANVIDYKKLPDGGSKIIECSILFNSKAYPTVMRCGFPPNKREARMWVYDLHKYVGAREQVMLGMVNNELLVVPLGAENKIDISLTDMFDESKLNDEAIERINKQTKDRRFRAFKKDHIELAKRNKLIGLAGELFVLNAEKQKLITRGYPEIAEMVEHKSVTEGDGLGYDILSFDIDEKPIFIEVKTTSGKLDTPFYISETELAFSSLNFENFVLSRVYEFSESGNTGKIRNVRGDLNKILEVIPYSFRAKIN